MFEPYVFKEKYQFKNQQRQNHNHPRNRRMRQKLVSTTVCNMYGNGMLFEKYGQGTDVVGVLVGHEKMVDVFDRNTHVVKDAEDSVSAACVYHKIFVFIAQGEASIVKIRYGSISGTEYVENFSVHMIGLLFVHEKPLILIFEYVTIKQKEMQVP